MSVRKFLKDRCVRYPKQAILKLLRNLPGSSTCVGPPRRFASETPNWVEKWNSRSIKARASCEIIHAPSDICRREPQTIYQSDTWQYRAWLQSCDKTSPQLESPATFFATIPNARVFGADGCVIAPDDAVLGDVSLDIDAVIAGDAEAIAYINCLSYQQLHTLKGKEPC